MIPQDGNVGSKPLRHAGKRNTIQIISKFKAKIRSKNSNNVLNSKLHKNFNVKRNIITAAVEQL